MATAIVNKNALLGTLMNFREMARGKAKKRFAVLCEVSFGAGKITVKTRGLPFDLDCETEGNGFFTKNYLYLMDVIKLQKGSTIQIMLSGQEVRIGEVVFNAEA